MATSRATSLAHARILRCAWNECRKITTLQVYVSKSLSRIIWALPYNMQTPLQTIESRLRINMIRSILSNDFGMSVRVFAYCRAEHFEFENLYLFSGIIESDDILTLQAEIDKSINYSRKCTMLVDTVKRKYTKQFGHVSRNLLFTFCALLKFQILRNFMQKHLKAEG